MKVLKLVFIVLMFNSSFAQLTDYKFGKGLKYTNADSTFSLKAAFRFQSLFISEWSVRNDDFNYVEGLESNFLIRRSRLKFDGYALNPKLKYKLELGLSNRDVGASDTKMFNSASNIILDAYFNYNFYKGFSILVGQTKLPGNRERVISSGDLQFVDRSYLNSRFNLDRDMGIQLSYKGKIANQSVVILKAAFSQGEGRNVTAGNMGGYQYTGRMEFLPFGNFSGSKGDYNGADLKREQSPKLAIGVTYDYNDRAGRNRGNLGSFINANGAKLKSLKTGIADLMFKYKGFSLMSEFAIRGTNDDSPLVFNDNDEVVATYYTGSAFSADLGYLFKNNYELAARHTIVRTQNSFVGNDQKHYTLGLSKYVVGHKLKIQTDVSYIQIADKNDELMWRLQFDFHL